MGGCGPVGGTASVQLDSPRGELEIKQRDSSRLRSPGTAIESPHLMS
jgi:hypothetical protein